MGKKNLFILLLLPFIIALLGVSVISMTFNLFDNDILGIGWDYEDSIGVKINSEKELVAYGINDKNYPVTNVKLVWSVENSDSHSSPNAEIISKNNKSYLKGLQEGEVKISCTNEKGNVYRYLNGIIYSKSAISITPSISSSQSNIDSHSYFGLFDFDSNFNKVEASYSFNITTYGERSAAEVKILKVQSLIDNVLGDEEYIDVDVNNKKINISSLLFKEDKDEERKSLKADLKTIEIYLTFGFSISDLESGEACLYKFSVVNNGVNVYNYNDLLHCSNLSKGGEIIVLRRHLESLDNAYNLDKNNKPTSLKSNNIEMFGTYLKEKSFNFDNEVYRFTTTYNHEYIKQWNEFASNNKDYSPTSEEVIAGIRIQKDVYGNGYTINLHNLTYPYDTLEVNGVLVPSLHKNNLFKGPLPFYCLGDPNKTPLVAAYGQDNIGMYVDGDNITINDINLKNCDFGNNLANLEYSGTVLETNGDNISIINSRISSGKTVVKVMSSNNCNISNCLISYSRNFLLSVSSNEYNKVDDTASHEFISETGDKTNSNIRNYLSYNASTYTSTSLGDTALNNYLLGQFTNEEKSKVALNSIQEGLDYGSLTYNTDVDITDTLFYMSGIASIGLETMFNGPFLYNASPSAVKNMFYSMGGGALSSIVPLFATGIGGTSYPVRVNIYGSTRFYDYKKVDNIDLSGLILENISDIYNSLIGSSSGSEIREITIDDIFPLIPLLRRKIEQAGGLYRVQEDGKWVSYTNIPLAYYGGGKNNSIVNFISGSEFEKHITNKIDLSFLDEYLLDKYKSSGSNYIQMMKNILLKCVTIVTGFNPFSFVCGRDGYLYNQTPQVSTLINNYTKGNY